MLSDIRPFQMYDNLYFVGSRKVSVHIIKTEVGLIMIDTGYPDMYEQILESMEMLALSPKDLCAIFHSHGHIDHFGCTKQFKELSGAKTYISRIDNDIVNGTYDLSWAVELGLERLEPFNCDVLIEDGDTFTFGQTTIECKLTPGHTDGVLSYFVNLGEGERQIRAAMHGGAGTNSMSAKFLNQYQLPFTCRDAFINSLHAMANEHVDLFMGNHPGQNDTEGKLNRILAGETSVVDPLEWDQFLKRAEQNLMDLIAREENTQ